MSVDAAAVYAASVQNRVALGPRSGAHTVKVGRNPAAPFIAPPGARLATLDGFSLHASNPISTRDRTRLERLCRYTARPPIATDRLHLTPDGRVRSDLRRPFSDGTHAVVFSPYEFIEKLFALIPPPRANLVTYHGVLAPAHTWRARIVRTIDDRSPLPRRRAAATDNDTPAATERVRRHTWAELMRRVFDLDVLECPHCHGRRRLIALITDPPVIHAILDALGIQPAPRAPPMNDFAFN